MKSQTDALELSKTCAGGMTPRQSSTHDVQNDAAIDAMTVTGFLAKERRRVILRLDHDEPIVPPQPPAAGVPLDATADVGRQKRRCISHADFGFFEETQAADA